MSDDRLTRLQSPEAVYLTLDPALHTSGATLLIPDHGESGDQPYTGDYVLHEYGRVQTQSERERYMMGLLEMADEYDVPPVIVAEIWDPPRGHDQRWTYETVLGIGEGWGRWSAEIEAANEFRREENLGPDIILERVTPNDWRDAVLGRPRAVERDPLNEATQRLFEGVFGIRAILDVAVAGCIGLYAIRSPRVAQRILDYPKRPPPKSKAKRKSERKKRRR